MAKAAESKVKPDTVKSQGDLPAQLHAIETERTRLADEIQRVETTKIESKRSYEGALNRGDEGDMHSALAQIRAANTERADIEDQLRALPGRLAEVLGLAECDLKAARERRAAAEDAVSAVRKTLEAAERDVLKSQGVFSQINTLRDRLAASAPVAVHGVNPEQ